MARGVAIAWLLLGCLLVVATTAQRHMMQEEPDVVATAASDVQQTETADPSTLFGSDPIQAGQVEADEFRIDPTPGPIDVDPSQMGRRNGFYRQATSQISGSC